MKNKFIPGLLIGIALVTLTGAALQLQDLQLTSALDANSYPIENLVTGTNSASATTVGYVTNAITLSGTNYATSAQGATADTALQPADDGSALTGMIWSQIGSTPTTLSGYGITDAATFAQGTTADSALQPGAAQSDISGLVTDLAAKQPKVDFISSAPGTATSTGTTGQLIYAGNYLYICIATDTWLRAQLLTW